MMDNAQSIAALVADGPATGQIAGGWDCISRTALRAWIEEREQIPSHTGWEGGYDAALADLKEFVNQGA